MENCAKNFAFVRTCGTISMLKFVHFVEEIMISAFDIEKLQNLLSDFYRITNIRITVFDHDGNELVAYPENCAFFCRLIRSTQEGRLACAQCDREACAAASKQRSAYIYQCHAGLTEAIMPLWIGNTLVGFLLFGHIFASDAPNIDWKHIRTLCAGYPIPEQRLREALADCPHVDHAYILSAAKILHATAAYLVLERMATLREDSAAARLDRYLEEHFSSPLTTESLCQTLGIGRTQLYKLSSQLYGHGVFAQIRSLRIEKAKHLLSSHPEMRITEISTQCGFSDYNYFISVFTKTVGQPPNAYRKQLMSSTLTR